MQDEIKQCSWLLHKNKRVEIVLSRLRLGHVGVNKHLFRFGMSQTPKCIACNIGEDIQHFILKCPTHQIYRNRMMNDLADLGIENSTTAILLGGGTYKK